MRLERYLFTADQVAAQIEAAGLREICRVVRRPQTDIDRWRAWAGTRPVTACYVGHVWSGDT